LGGGDNLLEKKTLPAINRTGYFNGIMFCGNDWYFLGFI